MAAAALYRQGENLFLNVSIILEGGRPVSLAARKAAGSEGKIYGLQLDIRDSQPLIMPASTNRV